MGLAIGEAIGLPASDTYTMARHNCARRPHHARSNATVVLANKFCKSCSGPVISKCTGRGRWQPAQERSTWIPIPRWTLLPGSAASGNPVFGIGIDTGSRPLNIFCCAADADVSLYPGWLTWDSYPVQLLPCVLNNVGALTFPTTPCFYVNRCWVNVLQAHLLALLLADLAGERHCHPWNF